ncbi:hypothetical protein GOODEAATRI_013654 [Goodea atripinnis]|uniref:DCN1-like protein n=1 Tax=Goodea atripinnis TaxID=208336 RepID=A0ABV0PNB3_9TELE
MASANKKNYNTQTPEFSGYFVVMLVLAWKLDAQSMGYFTLQEWLRGMGSLQCDSTERLRNSLDYLRSVLNDSTSFKLIYRYAFDFARLGVFAAPTPRVEESCSCRVLLPVVVALWVGLQQSPPSGVAFCHCDVSYCCLCWDNMVSYADYGNAVVLCGSTTHPQYAMMVSGLLFTCSIPPNTDSVTIAAVEHLRPSEDKMSFRLVSTGGEPLCLISLISTTLLFSLCVFPEPLSLLEEKGEFDGGGDVRSDGSVPWDVISRRFRKREMPRFIAAHLDRSSGFTSSDVLLLSFVGMFSKSPEILLYFFNMML